VIIVSSELDEIYALADRIAVMYEGRITGFRDPDVSATELGRLMAGGADGGHALEFGPLPEMDHSATPDSATPDSATTAAAPEAQEALEGPESPKAPDAADSQEKS
jgi:general nucleoside transport system ATP-binding protein